MFFCGTAIHHLRFHASLLLSIDDTTHKKTGRKIDGARTCRDAVRSTKSKTVFCWALQYIPLCLVYHPPWGGEPLSIPINICFLRLRLWNERNKAMLLRKAATRQ